MKGVNVLSSFFRSKKAKRILSIFVCALACVAMCSFAYAGDSVTTNVDIASIGQTIVDSIVGQLITLVGVVATGITGVFTIKIGITKAFDLAKNLLGKV